MYGPLDSENERTIDFDLIEVSDVIRNGNGTAINFNLLIDNSIPAGRYGLSLREELQFHHSNEIEVIVE